MFYSRLSIAIAMINLKILFKNHTSGFWLIFGVKRGPRNNRLDLMAMRIGIQIQKTWIRSLSRWPPKYNRLFFGPRLTPLKTHQNSFVTYWVMWQIDRQTDTKQQVKTLLPSFNNNNNNISTAPYARDSSGVCTLGNECNKFCNAEEFPQLWPFCSYCIYMTIQRFWHYGYCHCMNDSSDTLLFLCR